MEHREEKLIAIPFGESKIDALFYHSTAGVGEGMEPVVIHVHGFLGNFLDGSQRFLPPILARHGYSSLAINTRMANFGLFFGYGLIDDTLPQIDASIRYLQSMGYEKIILSGYSLGGCIVLKYASARAEEYESLSLLGFVVLACPYSMPASIRRRWNRWGSQPSYDEVYEEARGILRGEPENSAEDRTIIIFKARGESYRPEHTEIYTYKTWWHLAGPEADSAKGHMNIQDIKQPILLIQGSYDDVVDSHETYELAQIAKEAGNDDVSVFYVNAGHRLEEKKEELGDIVVKWLDKRL